MGCVELFEYEMVLIEKELEKVNKRLAELKEINKCYEDN